MGAPPDPPESRAWVVAVVLSAGVGGRSTHSVRVPTQRVPGSGPEPGPEPGELPAAVAGQRRPVDRVVLVNVAGPSPAAAVVQALPPGALPPDDGFVWLLDASTRPAPDALDRLLACAALDPGAAVLGPTGFTVDRSGRRRLAPGEPMAVRDVLAVERAGALVRGSAWDLLTGLNPWAGRADDLDLCWRAWRAGLRVVVVPSARLLPPERGVAEPATASSTSAGLTTVEPSAVGRPAVGGPVVAGASSGGRVARTDALRVRIAQSGFLVSPATVGCVLLAGLARVARALVRGRVRAAAVEALVVAGALADPARLCRLRRRSAAVRRVPARALRGLLPRPARPELVPRPVRAARQPVAERVRRPLPLVRPPVLLAAALIAAGCVLTDLGRDGGRPAPLPATTGQLWAAVWSGWLGPAGGLLGGPGPAPSWTPILALLSSVLGGRPGLAARVLVAGAPALAGLAGYAAARTLDGLGGRRWARAALGACYALTPPVTAAAQSGRLAAVGACVAAPLLLAAAVRALVPAAADQSPGSADGPGRIGLGPAGAEEASGDWAAWWPLAGAALLGAACAPGLLGVTAVGLLAAAVTLGRRGTLNAARRGPSSTIVSGRAPGPRRLLGRVGVVLLVGCAPLLPALGTAARGGPREMLAVLVDEPGRAGTDAPALEIFAVVCVLAALLGGRQARTGVAVCWLVAAAGWVTGQDPLGAAGLLAGVGLAWSGRWETARASADLGPPARRATRLPRRTVLASTLTVVLVAGPVLLFARASDWLGRGPQPVGWGSSEASVPRAVAAAVAASPSVAAVAADPSGVARTLVLRPSASAVTYTLTAGPGPTLVDTAGAPGRPARAFLAAVVADLSVGGGWGASALPALGVDEVWLPAPTSGATTPTASGLVGALDAAAGLERDQPRSDGYYWRLEPAAGPVAELRLLAPGPAAATGAAPGRGARTGTVAATRAAVARRMATGPGTSLGRLSRAPDGTSVDARVAAGPAGRLLVLAEPADPGWRATLAGRRLVPVTAWGWAQAFVVPAGPQGEVRIRYDHAPHRALVLAEAAVVAAFLLAAPAAILLVGRRRQAVAGWEASR